MLFSMRCMVREEDGVAQSYFEYLRVPYTHSGVVSSYNSMNKLFSKEILRNTKF